MAQIILLTGLAGAGRTTAADILEDIGFYVIENLPAAIVSDVVSQMNHRDEDDSHIAIAVDISDETSINTLFEVREHLRANGDTVNVVFLDADDDTIIRRFEQTRRPHPYISAGVLTKGIEIERGLLSEVLANADVHIDTTMTNPTQLGQQLMTLFSGHGTGTTVVLSSFGFKHGTPRDADFIFDTRFLPNPFWESDLQALTGHDERVREYVRSFDGYGRYVDSLTDTLEIALDEFARLGKGFVTLAIGCTGGMHRSVTVVHDLYERLSDKGYNLIVLHRELESNS